MNVKRLGLKEIRVHFGTFDYAIFCIVGPSTNVCKYVAWKQGLPEGKVEFPDIPNIRGLFFARLGWPSVIWLARSPRTPEQYATLAHEVLHAIREMLVNWAGLPLTRDTDEAYCHAMGHAMRTILTALK